MTENLYNTIPCIKDKCITYPTCRTKEDIKCPYIDTFYHDLISGHNGHHRNYVWNLIKEALTEMRSIKTYMKDGRERPGVYTGISKKQITYYHDTQTDRENIWLIETKYNGAITKS